VDVDIRAAHSGTGDLDQDFIVANRRDGDVPQFESSGGGWFDKRFHARRLRYLGGSRRPLRPA
jgi:hypothetical protein